MKKRNPLRLTRGEEEMVRAIRECQKLNMGFRFDDYLQRWSIVGDEFRSCVYQGGTLSVALEKAKEARR